MLGMACSLWRGPEVEHMHTNGTPCLPPSIMLHKHLCEVTEKIKLLHEAPGPRHVSS